MTVGYYVHHVGRGHLHRATALACYLAAAGGPMVTGLSSLPRPVHWPGEWVQLARDDDQDAQEAPCPTARGRLHWVPRHHDGLRKRSAQLSAWIARARPHVVVVDLSVEVTLLARLHGVPVVSVVLPGLRDDPAHLLGIDVADELVAFWPEDAHGMLRGVPVEVHQRVHRVGALSRYPVATGPRPAHRDGGGLRAVHLVGAGGHASSGPRAAGDWTWTTIGADGWVDDPSTLLRAADVVVTHAGQNALAEVAALRRPAVVVPQVRPHDEQATTAAVLREGPWPALVLDDWPRDDAPLEAAVKLDGSAWSTWCDGGAVERFAAIVEDVAAR